MADVKKHHEQAFGNIILLTHIYLIRCLVSGKLKSHCCNDTFTDVLFTLLLHIKENVYTFWISI